MKSKILFATLLFLAASQLFPAFSEELKFRTDALLLEPAQTAYGEESEGSSDSLDGSTGEKHYAAAVANMFLFNGLLLGYNYFVIGTLMGSGWAKPGWDDVKEFWKKDMKWDRDWYWTNFVLHPYQGNFYYAGARACNLNFAESLAVTVAGSLIWEWFCETNAPSTNDMVYTTVGSFAVGEMLYRLSLEGTAKHPALGYFIAPTRLFTEFVTGERSRGTRGNIHELNFRLSLGASRYQTKIPDMDYSDAEVFPVFARPELYVVYNDPYGHDSDSPYSQFELNLMGGAGSGSESDDNKDKFMYDVRIFSNGMLWSRKVGSSDKFDTTVGLVMDYDFMWHSLIQFSSLAPGFAVKQRVNGEKSTFEWQAHLDGIVLGTTDLYHYRRKIYPVPDSVYADYSYGMGAECVLKARWLRGPMTIDGDLHAYALYDLKSQVQDIPSEGWEFFGLARMNFEFAVTQAVSLGLGGEFYAKQTKYKELEDARMFGGTGMAFVKVNL